MRLTKSQVMSCQSYFTVSKTTQMNFSTQAFFVSNSQTSDGLASIFSNHLIILQLGLEPASAELHFQQGTLFGVTYGLSYLDP